MVNHYQGAENFSTGADLHIPSIEKRIYCLKIFQQQKSFETNFIFTHIFLIAAHYC